MSFSFRSAALTDHFVLLLLLLGVDDTHTLKERETLGRDDQHDTLAENVKEE